MSDATDTPACGCCAPATPPLTNPANQPGLDALNYRVGTHGSFRHAMLAAIAGTPALGGLTTREGDDPAIALADAWAMTLDVLTFYQERIANEGFLRTALERRSVLELARSIGYELRPGVAASTSVAFTLDTTAGSPEVVTIPVATKIQSTPKAGQQPQLFETVEAIEARPAWNVLRPQQRALHAPAAGDRTVTLKGTATRLQPGDVLLIVGGEQIANAASNRWDVRHVQFVTETPHLTDPALGYTVVTLDRPLGNTSGSSVPPTLSPTVHALRQRARLFGHNAPKWNDLPVALRIGEKDPNGAVVAGGYSTRSATWVEAPFAAGTTAVHLDAVYPRVVPGSWVVFSKPGYQELFHVMTSVEEGIADFLLASTSTRLTLAGEHIEYFDARSTIVFAASEQLEFAPAPLPTAVVGGDAILLDGVVNGLGDGRALALTGRSAVTGDVATEMVTIKHADVVTTTTNLGSEARTRLTLAAPLARSYAADTVTIGAHVAQATHGETHPDEVLGSGDAGRVFQRFALKVAPLTFVSAATASGAASTLEVRVNGVTWDETDSFLDAAPGDHVYQLRLSDGADATITFGDGVHGARPPSGIENVRARYRVGAGLAGLVDARQLNLLLTRPLGVKEAVNPIPAVGADDPERLEDARTNAPLTVLTLGRIVSLRDIEDFARAFAGVGKAQATLLWVGQQRLAHLTVSGPQGAPIVPGSAVHTHLLQALDGARHADRTILVQPHRTGAPGELPRTFDVAATLVLNPRAIAAEVLERARARLVLAFAFDRRGFGESVTASEVVAVLQRTPDVVAVTLTALHFTRETPTAQTRLPAQLARVTGATTQPAELLTVRPDGVTLTGALP